MEDHDTIEVYQEQPGRHTKNLASSARKQQSSYEVWHNFFLSAGIPTNVSNDYAITFSQHRIRIDMLKEITKDILLDMGIKAMGDIIAILRHAKSICTQNELKTTGFVRSPPVPTSTTSAVKASTSQTAPAAASSDSVKHVSQRLSIGTSRSSLNLTPATSSGGQIQSRLNLSSGALMASYSAKASANSDILYAKRTSSPISESLAKRLRPAPNAKLSPERTLTVHYPPLAAIAKAAQRISNSNTAHNSDNKPSNHHTSSGSSSIKSRLGSAPGDNNNHTRTRDSKITNKYDHRGSLHNRISDRVDSSDARRYGQRHSNDRTSRGGDSTDRHAKDGQRETVFNRLG